MDLSVAGSVNYNSEAGKMFRLPQIPFFAFIFFHKRLFLCSLNSAYNRLRFEKKIYD